MRPVLRLLQDLQRSLGYFSSVHREASLETMVGLGSTFKILGCGAIGQQLQVMPAGSTSSRRSRQRPGGRDLRGIQREHGHGVRSGPSGHRHAPINANLVPVPVLREQMGIARPDGLEGGPGHLAGEPPYRPLVDWQLSADPPREVKSTINKGEQLQKSYEDAKAKAVEPRLIAGPVRTGRSGRGCSRIRRVPCFPRIPSRSSPAAISRRS